MSATDSVSVFAEGTFADQIRELVTFLARGKPEDERAAFIAPFQAALAPGEGGARPSDDPAKRKDVVGLLLGALAAVPDGQPREIEGFFNLVYAHFLTAFDADADDGKARLSALLQTISASSADPSIKYRILSNLFNALPRTSGARLAVCDALLTTARTHDELEALALTPADVDRWLGEWTVPAEAKAAFLERLADAFAAAQDPDTAYTYTLARVRALSADAPGAQPAALAAIATALQLPALFDFEPLLALPAVQAAGAHPLRGLLDVFLGGGLDEYAAWAAANGAAVSEFSLDPAVLERKMRLLVLSALAFEHVGRDVAYSAIASALHVPAGDVEAWAIDAIRAGLVGGKLSQAAGALRVARAQPRTFGPPQWAALEQRLLAWQAGLAGVLDVVLQAQKAGGRPGAPPGAAQDGAKGAQEPAQPA